MDLYFLCKTNAVSCNQCCHSYADQIVVMRHLFCMSTNCLNLWLGILLIHFGLICFILSNYDELQSILVHFKSFCLTGTHLFG